MYLLTMAYVTSLYIRKRDEINIEPEFNYLAGITHTVLGVVGIGLNITISIIASIPIWTSVIIMILSLLCLGIGVTNLILNNTFKKAGLI